MKYIFLVQVLLFSAIALGNPIERENLSPTVKEPLIPGTKVPLKDLNTAPTQTPEANRSNTFRGTLRGSRGIESDDSEKEEEVPKKLKRGL